MNIENMRLMTRVRIGGTGLLSAMRCSLRGWKNSAEASPEAQLRARRGCSLRKAEESAGLYSDVLPAIKTVVCISRLLGAEVLTFPSAAARCRSPPPGGLAAGPAC